MKKVIDTSIIIEASAEQVWNFLTDFENYSNWNPFIKSINGQAHLNEKVEIEVHPPASSPIVISPIITHYIESKKLCWSGRILNGLIEIHHQFEIIPLFNEKVILKHRLGYSGWFVSLLNQSKMKDGIEMMNSKMKRNIENEYIMRSIYVLTV